MGLPANVYTGDSNGFVNYSVVDKMTLNKTDALCNSNKFYTIELHTANGKYRIFTNYGRLGKTSRKEVRYPNSLAQARSEYEALIRQKKGKGYVEVELVQSATGSSEAKNLVDTRHASHLQIEKKPVSKSSLHPKVQAFVLQIFNEASMKLSQLVRGNFGSEGASPLGKLSVYQISKGRDILQQIADIINRNSRVTVNDVIYLCNEYYSMIPRAFGMKITPEMISIRTKEKISEELDILKFYEDSLRMGSVIYEEDNIDSKYESLYSDIDLLDPNSSEHKEIVHYVNSTESRHHRVNLRVKNIFTVKQKKAPMLYTACGNVRSLFHGSRSANLPGILSSHLKLPSQLRGVQITGAMFGPGLYFADQSTKSSQYSCARFGGTVNKSRTSFMFLCDVALGKIKEEYNSRYYMEPPRGYNSVKGIAGSTLLHNEYIVYKENQQMIKNIIEFEPKLR